MRSHRIGGFAAAGAAGVAIPAGDFPGSDMPEPEGGGRTVATAILSALLHAAAAAALIYLASQVVEIDEEDLIFVEVPKAAKDEPAPAPRVMKESMAKFAPAPSVAPDIVSPKILQDLAKPVRAVQIDTATIAAPVAPTRVAVKSIQVDQVSRVRSPVTGSVSAVVPIYQGSSVKGPVDVVAPVGLRRGPREVVRSGNTLGTGGPQSLGRGSSVKGGTPSNRDVFGATTGQIANARTGLGNMDDRGPGGNGTGAGVSYEECLARPEVQQYLGRVKDRTISRWSLPIGATTTRVTLSFKLDVAGSTGSITFQQTGDNAVGASAVDALKAASPFDHMNDRVRCLANRPLQATFKNPTVDSN